MKRNIKKFAMLVNEFISIIDKSARRKLTTDNIIVFNDPIYFSDDEYENDDYIDALVLDEDGEEIILVKEEEQRGNLCDLPADMLAEMADKMENKEYKVEN